MQKKVIVLGGGVAGMSAAHELIERGFEVDVYEKNRIYPGGKARSVHVPGTNKLFKDKHLPGEHGFRFFPGFYKHVIDTMKRIPYKDGNSVFDNLADVSRVGIFRAGKTPIDTVVSFPQSITDIKAIIETLHADTGLTSAEKHFFAKKIWQIMTSCYDRRLNEYEKIGWWEFMEAERFSETYQALLVEGITRTLVAANAKTASTKTDGDIFLQLLFNMTNPGVHTDRVLNGPTNDVWINPWLDYLRSQGVQYHFNQSVRKIEMQDGAVTGMVIEEFKSGVPERKTVTADYYILAVPIEVAATLMSKEVLAADPGLKGIVKLAHSVSWMNGIQFYLSEAVDIVHGHCLYSDSPWALTSISQLQFWKDYDIENRFDGSVKGILSVDISNWKKEGIVYGKFANHCSFKEIKNEVWAQLKSSLNVNGAEVLRDDMILHWYIDHDIHASKKDEEDKNKEPLLVNTVNSWNLRPEAYTNIPNLFLASDYVQTYTDLATMEGANEAARRAVNALIEAAGSNAEHCKIWNLHEPGILMPFRNRDEKRFKKGLPYKFREPLLFKIIFFILKLFSKRH